MNDMKKKLIAIEKKLEKINERLNLAEGNIGNLQMSHRSHTNYDPIEFANMHGYNLERLVEIVKKIEDLKKLTSPAAGLPTGVSEYVLPDAFRGISRTIHYAMRLADELASLVRDDEDGDTTVVAWALVKELVEIVGLKLEVE